MTNSVITLRDLTVEDAETIASWAADPAFCAHAGWSFGLSPQAYLRFHTDVITDPPADLLRLGAVHGGSLVGYVDLHGTDSTRRELGFLIGDPELWGRGLGRAAAAAGLTHGFERLELETIWAEAPATHIRSIRILRHLGLVETTTGGPCTFLGEPTFFRRFAIEGKKFRERAGPGGA